jgi:hypothetical protein
MAARAVPKQVRDFLIGAAVIAVIVLIVVIYKAVNSGGTDSGIAKLAQYDPVCQDYDSQDPTTQATCKQHLADVRDACPGPLQGADFVEKNPLGQTVAYNELAAICPGQEHAFVSSTPTA